VRRTRPGFFHPAHAAALLPAFDARHDYWEDPCTGAYEHESRVGVSGFCGCVEKSLLGWYAVASSVFCFRCQICLEDRCVASWVGLVGDSSPMLFLGYAIITTSYFLATDRWLSACLPSDAVVGDIV